MKPHATSPDLGPGEKLVSLTELRAGDLVRLERVDARTVGLRAIHPDEAAAHAGPLFRIEAGEKPGAARLVQVRTDGPLN